jgi:hypothetical protein
VAADVFMLVERALRALGFLLGSPSGEPMVFSTALRDTDSVDTTAPHREDETHPWPHERLRLLRFTWLDPVTARAGRTADDQTQLNENVTINIYKQNG